MEHSGKIAVLGDKDSVELFRAAGAQVKCAENEFEAARALKEATDEGCAVIFVTENVAALISEKIEESKSEPFPIVIPIPSALGSNGMGMKGVRKDVEKAIGADILFKE